MSSSSTAPASSSASSASDPCSPLRIGEWIRYWSQVASLDSLLAWYCLALGWPRVLLRAARTPLRLGHSLLQFLCGIIIMLACGLSLVLAARPWICRPQSSWFWGELFTCLILIAKPPRVCIGVTGWYSSLNIYGACWRSSWHPRTATRWRCSTHIGTAPWHQFNSFLKCST